MNKSRATQMHEGPGSLVHRFPAVHWTLSHVQQWYTATTPPARRAERSLRSRGALPDSWPPACRSLAEEQGRLRFCWWKWKNCCWLCDSVGINHSASRSLTRLYVSVMEEWMGSLWLIQTNVIWHQSDLTPIGEHGNITSPPSAVTCTPYLHYKSLTKND